MDVLVIRGAFAPPDQMARLPDALPGPAIAFRNLNTDGLRTVDRYIAAIDAGIRRPTIVLGISLGGVVALGLRNPRIAGVLALDPTLRTDDLPAWLRQALADRMAEAPRFLWSVFGIGDGHSESRDYLRLLDGRAAPAVILAGSLPESMPSSGAVGEETLRLAATRPNVTARRIPNVGHDIGLGATSAILAELRALLAAA